MKNNWLITQTIIGLVVSSFCARGAESLAPDPVGDELGYPTNELIALELGRADAARDLSQGVLRLPIYGSPIEWSSDFSRILEEKYNIDRYGLGGPSITPSLAEYARGYGEISDRAIKEKFGTNFFEHVLAEAKQAYEQRMQAQAAATPAAPKVAVVTPVAITATPTVVTTTPTVVTTTPTVVTTTPTVVTTTPTVATGTPSVATTPVAATLTMKEPVAAASASATLPVVAQNVAPANRTYRVKPGDTFWEIARQHRVPVSSLVAANPGVNPGKLQINHNLNVPTVTRP
ncbi:MAG TPA: LysM peptidoglycan-binding domain-containing protein [Verrucomicrobiae bacterium]